METYRERCEREDEADRLASVSTRYELAEQAKAMNGPERLGLAVSLLMGLVDDDVLKGWSVQYPEREAGGSC